MNLTDWSYREAHEFFDEITRQTLIDAYKNVQNCDDDPKLLKAIRRCIQFYSLPEQWKEFKDATE